MTGGFTRATTTKGPRRRVLLAHACALAALACALQAARAGAGTAAPAGGAPGEALAIAGASSAASDGGTAGALPAGGASAALERCLTAALQTERAATFSGEMTATGASVRMAMEIEIEVRLPGEEVFHAVNAPGLVWRVSDPGVRTYRYVRQFTNLSAPAAYRAVVRFRWLNAKNHVIKVAERRTARCEQPAHSSAAGSSTAPAHPSPSAA